MLKFTRPNRPALRATSTRRLDESTVRGGIAEGERHSCSDLQSCGETYGLRSHAGISRVGPDFV